MKKIFVVGFLLLFVISFFTISVFAQDFPKKDLNGIIQWGAGGETDNVSRALTPLVEKYLGKTIILQNKPGATGALAAQNVLLLPPDGYHLLFGAENPQLYKVLELADFDYADFYCINLLARGIGVLTVPADSPYDSVDELVNDAKNRPGQILNGITGPGGLPFTVSAMMKSVNGVEFNQIPYGGTGPAMTAMLGGHVDMVFGATSTATEMVRAGKMKALAVIDLERVEELPGVPAITEIYPEYEKFLPWGPFYGVFVRKDVPEDRKNILIDAFQKGFQEERFQKFITDAGSIPMGIYGEEAAEWLNNWQSTSCWLLYEAGATEKSPEEFGIPKP